MAEPGPFDHILQTTPPERRDRGTFIVIGVILGLALILLILILPPISMLKGGGNGAAPKRASGNGVSSSPRSSMPELPAGLEAVSQLYDIKAPDTGESVLTIKLKGRQTDARNLAFYSYVKGEWKRVASASITADGNAATGEVPFVPENVAVLRRAEMSQTVLGFLPAGAKPDAQLGGSLGIISPLNYLLAADGKVAGAKPAVAPSDASRLIPTVIASDPALLEDMLRSPEARDAHIQSLTELARTEGFSGFNLDYRSINAVQREDFVRMVESLAQALHQDGRQLVLTLPLPLKQGGGWDTAGFDWERLAGLADLIVVRPEEDQSLFLKRTKEGLDYATARVDRAKLLLEVTTLSREKASEGMRTLPLVDALSLAATPQLRKDGPVAPGESVTVAGQNLLREEGATGIAWDDEALAVRFTYPGRGGKRTVWLANQFSVAFRIDIARSYHLAGIALEDASVGDAAGIWDAARQYAESGEVQLVRPNDEMMAPHWSANAGTLDTARGELVVWRAPTEPGTYEIVLSVGDGVVRVGQKLAVDVRASGGPPE